MNEFTKLECHYISYSSGGGVTIGTVRWVSTLGNGTTVEIPSPFIRLDDHLGIQPAISSDGDAELRIDFTRWSPLRFGHDLTAGFPFNFSTQALAVRVTRAFEADPRTSWRDTPDQISTWLHAWGAGQGPDFGIPAGGAR